MAAFRGMGPKETAKFVADICGDDMHAARAASLANAVTGALATASLGVSAIGTGLALAQGTMRKHGVKQVDRLLSNAKLDVWKFFGAWVAHVIGARKEVVVSMDWVTGLLYVDTDAGDCHDVLGTPETPLNALDESALCPGAAALERANAALR